MPEINDRGAPPEPVAVLDAVDDEPGLEDERVRSHRVVVGVGVLLDVEVPLDDALRFCRSSTDAENSSGTHGIR